MKRFAVWILPLLVFCAAVPACSKDLKLTVLFDRATEIKPGDRVYWDEKTIGEVQAAEMNSDGKFAVRLKVGKNYREDVTDQCRFAIRFDPGESGRQAVEMFCLAKGGEPLPDGAQVAGVSSMQLFLEQGSRQMEAWSKTFRRELDRWEKELRELPESEWYKNLERNIDDWAHQMRRAGKDARQYFKEEVLPALEEALREFKRRLPDEGRRKDTEPLEKKLEDLRTI